MSRDKREEAILIKYYIKDHKIMIMDKEKRERIIAAALKEFTKGYATANMDNLAEEAGISKGLIFHYFGSKTWMSQQMGWIHL